MIPRVGVIGFGNMGEALAMGLAKKNLAESIGILESNPVALAKARKQKRLTVHPSLEALLAASDLVVIAIKPQDIPALLEKMRPHLVHQGIVSIAAGLTTSYFQKSLGTANVVRFMPNLSAKVAKSVVGVSIGLGCSETTADQAQILAGSIGQAAVMPEKLLAAITGLSGSGIAYVFHFVHALAMGGVQQGFAYPQALSHALGTLEGAVALLRETGEHPIAFESKVCSPSGTTIEGVRVLEESGFSAAVIRAVGAAAERARELEG